MFDAFIEALYFAGGGTIAVVILWSIPVAALILIENFVTKRPKGSDNG